MEAVQSGVLEDHVVKSSTSERGQGNEGPSDGENDKNSRSWEENSEHEVNGSGNIV